MTITGISLAGGPPNGFPSATALGPTDLIYMAQGGAEVAATVAQMKTAMAVNAARETFVNGTGFTAGTSTSITLAGSYGSINNILVFFDAAPQLDCTLSGNVLSFNPIVPLGISQVVIIAGTSNSIGTPADGTVTDPKVAAGSKLANRISTVNVLDPAYGADPTGVSDSTAAFQTAFNTGRQVIVPAGTYVMGNVVIPSNTVVIGEGSSSLIQPIAGFSAQQFWTVANAAANVKIGHLQFNLPEATFPNTIPIYTTSATRCNLHHIYIPGGGNIGIYAQGLINSFLSYIDVTGSQQVSILLQSCSNVSLNKCNSNSPQVSHGISIQGGNDIRVSDCYSTASPGFGITMQGVVRGRIINSNSFNSLLEGFTIGGDGASDNEVSGCTAAWSGSTSTDFGMSCACNTTGIQGMRFRGNTIVNCGKSGIAFAADATAGTTVSQSDATDNLIINSNALGLGTVNGGGAGILLYGGFCTGNLVKDNRIYDNRSTSLTTWGVFETSIGGGGQASNNEFSGTKSFGMLNGAISKNVQSTESECQSTSNGFVSWVPVVTSTGGTLGTHSTNYAYFREDEKKIDITASILITTNGTGAGAINITLPFTSVAGFMQGRDTATGKALVGKCNGVNLTIQFYDGTYPGSSGANIEFSGFFFRQ